MDTQIAHFNMIEQQIRPWEVLDPRVLQALHDISREQFVPSAFRKLAFADLHIPLAHGQVMMQPKQEARLVQALNLSNDDRILEVGTGSGYVTALLSELGGHVDTVEYFPDLLEQTQSKLEGLGYESIEFSEGDAAVEWSGSGPYDAILLTGSVAAMPEGHQNNLALGGRLVAVVGVDPVMEALLVERISDEQFRITSLFDTSIPALINAEAKPYFSF